MIKRFLFVILAIGIIFFSCIDPEPEEEKIIFWIPFGEPSNAYLNQIVNEYNASGPEIKVELVQMEYSSYEAELAAAVNAGNPPDVVMLDRFKINQWAAQNLLYDLTPYHSMINIDDYAVFAWKETQFNGKTFALPFDADVRVLYYNKKMLKDASLNPDDLDFHNSPIALSQLKTIARGIDKKNANGDYERIGFIPQMDQGHHYTWGLVFGGEFASADGKTVTPDTDEIVYAYKFLYNWNLEMGADKVKTFLDGFEYKPGSDKYHDHPFIKEKLAMTINGDWFLDVLEKHAPNLEYGVTFIPALDERDAPVTWTGGYAWAIPAASKNASEAVNFLTFGAGAAGQRIYCRQFNKAPTLMSLLMEKWYVSNQFQSFFHDIYRLEITRPILPVGAAYWDALSAAQDTIIKGPSDSDAFTWIKGILKGVKNDIQTALDIFYQEERH